MYGIGLSILPKLGAKANESKYSNRDPLNPQCSISTDPTSIRTQASLSQQHILVPNSLLLFFLLIILSIPLSLPIWLEHNFILTEHLFATEHRSCSVHGLSSYIIVTNARFDFMISSPSHPRCAYQLFWEPLLEHRIETKTSHLH
jgi:hypothetical protein